MSRILSTGGVYLSACWDTTPSPWDQAGTPQTRPPGTRYPPGPGSPPGPGTPQTRHSPGTRNPPWTRQPPDQALPWDQEPPGTEHAGRYGQRAGGMHPTGMQSCSLLILQFIYQCNSKQPVDDPQISRLSCQIPNIPNDISQQTIHNLLTKIEPSIINLELLWIVSSKTRRQLKLIKCE